MTKPKSTKARHFQQSAKCWHHLFTIWQKYVTSYQRTNGVEHFIWINEMIHSFNAIDLNRNKNISFLSKDTFNEFIYHVAKVRLILKHKKLMTLYSWRPFYAFRVRTKSITPKLQISYIASTHLVNYKKHVILKSIITGGQVNLILFHHASNKY